MLKKNRFIPCLAVAAGIAAFSALPAISSSKKAQMSHDESYSRNMNTFVAVTRALEETYVDSIRVDEAFEGALEGLLQTVDPYTEYFPADSREDLTRLTTGAYGGIGSFVTGRNGITYIQEPIKGSPAMKAGLLPGDKIIRVDSVDVVGKKVDETTALLKGTPGTKVNVTVVRPYTAGPDSVKQFLIERAKVADTSVPWHGVLPGGLGYIRLTSFIETSARDVKKALEEFKGNPEVKGVVLDLRGNGGGLMEEALEILTEFVPKGTEVLRTRGKSAADEKIYKTRRNPLLADMPLAVLIDGGSASASEITAGAIQDLDRGVLVGSRSFGKGLVQGTRQLPYNGLLKVTMARYYTPAGRCIQALDYSRRNPDGTVAATPDSLANSFKTLHGRIVKDGGGLMPDSTVNWDPASALLFGLVQGGQIFDYATKFMATQPLPQSVEQLSLTDEQWDDFASGIKAGEVKYDKICLQILNSLRDAAKSEGYLNDDLKNQLDTLEKSLDHELRADLDAKRPQIEEIILEEIAARMEPGSGRIRRQVINDKGVEKAREILNDPTLYRQMLNYKL